MKECPERLRQAFEYMKCLPPKPNTKQINLNRKMNLKKYGLNSDTYNQKVVSQDNKCAICGNTFKKTPCIDHDHKSGKTRDLLCHKCNVVLGMCDDSIPVLLRAVDYLNKHNSMIE